MIGFFVTMGGLGRLRKAPGTWGSMGALVLMVLGTEVLGGAVVVMLTLPLTLLAYFAIAAYTRNAPDHEDPQEVVVDEWVGQWIALWSVAYGSQFADVSILKLWPGLIAGFLFFRLFDITKWGPIGWADRRGGAMGILLDDILAGIAALICVSGLGIAWHALVL